MTPPLFTIDGDVYAFTEDMKHALLNEMDDATVDAWFEGKTLYQAYESESEDVYVEETDVVDILQTMPDGMIEEFNELELEPVWDSAKGIVVEEGGVTLSKCL